MSCVSQNWDNYEWAVSDLCKRTYEDAAYRCEERMEYDHNYYYGKMTQGCDYLNSKVGALSNTATSAALVKERRENIRTAMIFVGATLASAAAVYCCFQKKRAQNAREGLEIISPADAVKSIQKSQKSARELVKSATKKVKESVHNAAKRVVDLTRSTSNAVKERKGAEDDNNDGEDGTYEAMDETTDDRVLA